jgi:membrane protein YqaA with SNARE-associated domain
MGKRLQALEGRLEGWLEHANRGHHLLGLASLLSFIGTLTAFYPVTAVLMTAVVLAPKRWLSLSLGCTVGSALAATAIVEIAHLLGYNEIRTLFPNLISMTNWQEADRWISDYGVLALFGVGVSPLPQMPLLIAYGILDDRLTEAFMALLAGKSIKYVLIAWVTQHFPEKLAFFRRIHGKKSAQSANSTA